jgi:hypothetical protein
MSTSDGSILGLQQIRGSAPRATAFNVLLMADGFTSAEQGSFDAASDSFADTFLAAAPFDALIDRINIFRLNVASTESGADIPNQQIRRRTFFDSSFGAGSMERLLVCGTATALRVAAQQLPEFSVAIVVVNSPVYGGSGGSVATYSLAAGADLVALHETGHTAFGLADEYAYYAGGNETGHDHFPGGEPAEPNVTANTNAATLKWRGAVATASLPMMTNLACGQEDPRPSLHPAGTVGLFEGARYFHCGAFRPEFNCRMRMIDQPFCTVCQGVIRARLGAGGLTDAPPTGLSS